MALILVIDDEAVVREPIAASLQSVGYTVECAGDGPSALEFLKKRRPDLILLDIRMPDMDGMAILRAVREEPATASVPVLLLTNSTERAMILQAAKLGVDGYLLKSAFSLEELLTRIKRLLAESPAAPAKQDGGETT